MTRTICTEPWAVPARVREQQNGRRNKMDRKERVDALLKANAGWGEDDREFLTALADAQFDKVEGAVKAQLEVNDKLTGLEKKVTDLEAAAKGKDEEEDEDEEEEEPKMNAEQYIAAAPEGVREVLAEGLRTHQRVRDGLVSQVLKFKTNKFTKEQLEAKPVDELRALVELAGESVKDADFSGAAAPRTNEQDADVPPMPKMNWKKG